MSLKNDNLFVRQQIMTNRNVSQSRAYGVFWLRLNVFLVFLFCVSRPGWAELVKVEALQSRAILDESFNWLRKQDAAQVVEKMKTAGFNVYIPSVWHGRGVTWPSKLAQKEPSWVKKAKYTFDPLQNLIELAHKEGIEVHPWFTVMLRQREIKRGFYDKGTPVDSFNVHNEDFRNYITSVIMEVVTNYDVDGINLDFVRAKGICNSEFCIHDYKKKTGRDLLADISVHASKALGEEWKSIAEWNRVAVTTVIRQISTEVRKIKPDIKISIDTHPLQNWLTLEGADGIGWANEGLIDLIYDMQYKKTLDLKAFKKAQKALKDPEKLALMVGNFDVALLDKNDVYSRSAWLLGYNFSKAISVSGKSNAIALYEYSFFSDDQVQKLRNGPLREYSIKLDKSPIKSDNMDE